MSNKRKHFTLEQKIKIVNEVNEGAQKSEVCRKYGLALSTLSTFLKSKDSLIAAFESSCTKRKRLRTTDKTDLDKALLDWFKLQRSLNVPISGQILQEKATYFGKALGYGEDFQCTLSWISRFKDRHGINRGKITGEAKSVDQTVTNDWLKNVWQISPR